MTSFVRKVYVLSVEQIWRSLRAKPKGMARLVCMGWHEECNSIDVCQSQFCVKDCDDFAVDDRDVDIQKGNGYEGLIASELNSVVDAIEVCCESVKILY